MTELFKLLGVIAIEGADKAKQEISGTTAHAETAGGKIRGALSKIGGGAVAVGKTVALGLGAGVTAMTALTSKAMNAAGQLEQNMGGSEAVFGESAKRMQETAKNAFNNMGLSMSDYLGTANKMGALFQGTGIGIEESAEMSANAMQRASDVASIMGIDVNAAMEAVAGMAKGNFTMMDNLGVAINDTTLQMYAQEKGLGKLETTQQKVNAAYELFMEKSAYASGNYEKENATFAGSMTSAKAALDNFLSGAGTAEQLADAFVGATSVIIQKLNTLFPNLVKGIQELIDKLMPELPKLMEAALPSLIQGAVALLTGLIQALPKLVQLIIEQIPFIVKQLGTAFVQTIPVLFETLKELFAQGIEYISELIPAVDLDTDGIFEKIQTGFQFLWDTVQAIWADVGQPIWDAIMQTFQYVSDNWTSISGSISTLFGVIWELCSAAWNSIGKPIWDMISYAIGSLMDLFSENMPAIVGFFQDAIASIKDTWDNHLKPVFDAIGKILKEEVQPAFEFVFETIIKPLIETVFGFIKDMWNNTLKPVFDGICDFLTGVFTDDWEKAMGGIGDIVDGVFSAIETTVESVIGFFDNAIGKIKEFLGFTDKANGVEVTTTTTTAKGGTEKYASGAVLTRAAAFGYNPFTGKTMIGGEAGAEAIAPIDVLQGYVRQAVAEQNQGMYMAFNRMADMLEKYMPEIVANSHKQIVLNNGALVAELAPSIDRELGAIASWKGRGNR